MSIERLAEAWPEWTVESLIGTGTYGRVYKATHVEQGVRAYAAIKVISIPQSSTELDSLRSEGMSNRDSRTYYEGIVNDFVSEIKLMHTLKGMQNIAGIEDFRVLEKKDAIGWDIFIRMELLTPFNAYLSDKRLSEAEVIKLGIDICSALEVCSSRNIIHRDIKPENIFVNDFGCFKLGDFGIARKMDQISSGFTQNKGTPSYMAPEVVRSTAYDARADLCSLGLVLYRLLNQNRLPFLETNKQLTSYSERMKALSRRLCGEPLPVPCDASPEMAALILKACAFDPNQRFATATEMKKALMQASMSLHVAAVSKAEVVTVPDDQDRTTMEQKPQLNAQATTATVYGQYIPDNPGGVAAEAVSPATPLREAASNPAFEPQASKSQSKKTTIMIAVAALLVVGIFAAFTLLVRAGRKNGSLDANLLSVGAQSVPGTQAETLSKIEVATLPDKTTYALGERLDTSGLTLTVTYRDGSTQTVSSGFTCTPTTLDRAGTRQITVTYEKRKATFNVTVTDTNAASSAVEGKTPRDENAPETSEKDTAAPTEEVQETFAIATTPNGANYIFGVRSSLPGFDQTAVEWSLTDVVARTDSPMDDAEVHIFDAGTCCVLNGWDYNYTLTASYTYDGETYQDSFVQTENPLRSITVQTLPKKTTYKLGETLDTSGLVLVATYSTEQTVKMDVDNFNFSPTTFNTTGTQTVTANHYGKTVSFEVTVVTAEEAAASGDSKEQRQSTQSRTDQSGAETTRTIEIDSVNINCVSLDGEGHNQNDGLVYWSLDIEYHFVPELTNVSSAISVSWCANLPKQSDEISSVWADAKAGKSYSGHWAAGSDFLARARVYLPDDRSIAGQQSVTISYGACTKTISFTLTYYGNYETGTGWGISNISY